jgi:hypothetical protein
MALSLVATPAQACWNNAEQDAARIANMNQMLMVSALRCRFGKQNFLTNYMSTVPLEKRNNSLWDACRIWPRGNRNLYCRNRNAGPDGACACRIWRSAAA